MSEDPERTRRAPGAAPRETRPVGDSGVGDSEVAPSSTGTRSAAPSDTTAPWGDGAAPALPAVWGRYEIQGFLGAGGMGEVYRAWDSLLKRKVALKLIRGGASSRAGRFLEEARLQARVEHAGVCKIYDAGVVDSTSYIAMQLIDGKPLTDVSLSMSLEKRVAIMKQVAEALHAAHRTGLIHRDVKPANILVERGEDGDFQPCVLDFGLAKDLEAVGLTMAGTAVGTPCYMAPEQAAGDSSRMDRRTDVYGLGATFYELLSGAPPFTGPTALDVMQKVLSDDPPPLRILGLAVPRDLETIVRHCLEKEPERRYDSARALADDLGRYLDGEPIAARPSTWGYRALKTARRHKAIVSVLAVSIAVVFTAGVVTFSAHRAAAERARVAQEFGQDVERIESLLRETYLLPLHDVRSERRMVRQTMRAIEERIQTLGATARGPGRYALGRGHLAIGELERAHADLSAAWDLGFRTSEAAYALGLARGELYRRELALARRIPSKEQREARLRELERTRRDPALEALRDSRKGRAEDPEYVEGLLAFYEGRYAVAVKLSRAAFARTPRLYRAKKLEGEAHLQLGTDAHSAGDYLSASSEYSRALEAIRVALTVGRSDPALYDVECAVRLRLFEIGLMRNLPSEQVADEVRVACGHALAADPESAPSYSKLALLEWHLGDLANARGEDPRPHHEKTIELARQAVRFDPQDAFAYTWMGVASMRIGEARQNRGEDPEFSLVQAARAYEEAVRINPRSPITVNALGLAWCDLGAWQASLGRDPVEALEKALAASRRSVHLDPKFAFGWNGLGVAYRTLANWKALAGEDPEPSFARALESYRAATAVRASYGSADVGVAGALVDMGTQRLERGLDPSDLLPSAHEALRRARAVSTEGLTEATGDLESLGGLCAIHRGESPEPFFRVARGAYEAAVRENPRSPSVLVSYARLQRRWAEWKLAKGMAGAAEIEVGNALAAKALTLNPTLAEAAALRGALSLLATRIAPTTRARSRRAAEAILWLERALSINSRLREVEPLMMDARRVATGPG